jgi:D-beta-D-heptose 7-phosphate kinase/D-beta-D-heptose 1-phosphate adenosyltransferase
VPVVRKRRASARPGGAANTAANLAALGASVDLLGVTGDDREAAELSSVLAESGIAGGLVRDPLRPTTTKTRVVAMHQQIVRVDEEETSPVSETTVATVVKAAADRIAHSDAVVVSDYAKGLVTEQLLQAVIGAAAAAGKKVLIDPKAPGVGRYRGAWLVKPNRLELGILTGAPVRDHEETAAAGTRLAAALPGTLVLVTEGPEGMSLYGGPAPLRVRPAARQVYDVTGAGDTVLAAMAMSAAAGASLEASMELASEAAAIAVGLLGTAAVTQAQLRAALEE